MENLEHRGVEDVAADNRVVARRLVDGRLLDEIGYLDDVIAVGVRHRNAPVKRNIFMRDTHQAQHRTAKPFAHLNHARHDWIALVDQVVTEQDGEWLITDVMLRH